MTKKKLHPDDVSAPLAIPPAELPWARIVSPRPGHPIRAVAINKQIERVYVHWMNGRSRPHLKDRSICEGCLAEAPRRFKAYLGAICLDPKEFILAELTHFACLENATILDDENCDLRGCEFILTRKGRGANGRVTLNFVSFRHRHNVVELPPPLPVLDILIQTWEGVNLSAKKHRPPQVRAGEQIPTPSIIAQQAANLKPPPGPETR